MLFIVKNLYFIVMFLIVEDTDSIEKHNIINLNNNFIYLVKEA